MGNYFSLTYFQYILNRSNNHAREHCTRNAQSSRGVCSRRVHKIEYLAVNKGNILVNFFTYANIHRELLSLINPAVYLLNKKIVG